MQCELLPIVKLLSTANRRNRLQSAFLQILFHRKIFDGDNDIKTAVVYINFNDYKWWLFFLSCTGKWLLSSFRPDYSINYVVIFVILQNRIKSNAYYNAIGLLV